MSLELCGLIETSLRTSEDILSSDFLGAKPNWLTEAGFILLIINLKDALLALEKLGERVVFKDDVQINGDITDLVREMRNASVHNGSILRMFDPKNHNSLHFGVVVGAGVLIKYYDMEISNPYSDDVAFFYGNLRILLSRHIVRAVQEARLRFRAKAPEFGYHIFN